MLNLDLTSQADHTRAFCAVILLVLALCAPVRTLLAQEKEHDEAERDRAFQLFADSRFTDALPVLEKLAAANPTDVEIIARLGFAILANSTTIKEPEARKRARLRARSVLLRAKELGADSDLLQAVLAALPPDGSDESSFSENREADQAIREGEAAFVRGDLDKALVAYERALKLDPKLYEAPLFAGDMYYKKGQMDKAGEWYARAIAINPDRETAYRYWGNVLMAQGKTEEARLKYIEAIIADPYSRYTWENGLVRWAQRKQVRLAHPQIEQPPSSVQASEEKGQTTIIFDRKKMDQKGADYYWSFYYLTRTT